MRSIRLSLMLYFLLLLAVALGAVSSLLFHRTRIELLEKQQATLALLQQRYHDQCEELREKLDKELLFRAYTLAGVARIQMQFGRYRAHPFLSLGVLSTVVTPQGDLTSLLNFGQAADGGRLASRTQRLLMAQIEFREEDLKQFSDTQKSEYYQISTDGGGAWRSRSMEDGSFPYNPAIVNAMPLYEPRFADIELQPGQLVRSVSLRAPVSRFYYPPAPRLHSPPSQVTAASGGAGPRGSRPPSREGEPRPNQQGTSGPGNGPRGNRPPPREGEVPAAPMILVQCGIDPHARDQALQVLKEKFEEDRANQQADSEATLHELLTNLLTISFLTFGATVLGSFCLVGLGLSPLRRLSDAVSKVSEKDLKLQVPERRLPAELRPIAQRLVQTFDQLRRAFTREKQAAADISHDLRTPLAAMLATTEVALKKERTPSEYRETIGECRTQAQQMSQMVERLLALARLDSGGDNLRPREVDAAALAEHCANLVRPLASARGLTLRVHRNGPLPVQIDADKLREVLTNLLHNAIEYNRPQGAVDLSVERANGTLRLEVRDTGIGIAPELHEMIFERFFRGDPARQADGLHAGLGLAIVKGYVELMGGEIRLDSKPAEGSTFRIDLPVRAQGGRSDADGA